MTNKISLTYPTSGLTVNVEVYKLPGETLDNSGVCNEVGTTGIYIYEFTDDGASDYSYVASVSGYDNLSGTIFFEATSGGGGGGISWNDLIEPNSSVVGSFGQKFAQYGGVSHVIDRSSFDEESKKRIDALEKAIKEFKIPEASNIDVDSIVNKIRDLIVIPNGTIDPSVLKSIVDKIPSIEEFKKSIPESQKIDLEFIEGFISEVLPELLKEIEKLKKANDEESDVVKNIIKAYEKERLAKEKEIAKLEKEVARLKSII